jgi:hypothetical protein
MKKTVLLVGAIVVLCCPAFCQENRPYHELRVTEPWFKNYTAQWITDSNATLTRTYIRDSKGEKAKFVSTAAVLNYVAKQGWELVSSYNDHGDIYFIMKKKSKINF